jgi:DNA adenine methylase
MNSPLCYIGGKSRLASAIISKIPEHSAYIECFAGAAWIFFKKDPSKVEIINDKDGDLVSFYKVLQNHLEEFLRQFRWLLSSREWWNDWNRQLAAGGLTDIQRAARYYYIQRQSFGGKVKGRTFGTSTTRPPRINLLRIEEDLSEIHLRLCGVLIEHLDCNELIKKYDREDSFFYLDPPYYKMPYYNYNFKMDDFTSLIEVLAGIKGKFLLSINSTPEMVKAFDRFNIQKINVPYSIQKNGDQTRTELLVSNYNF